MQKHTRIYLHFFKYDTSTFIPCEVCSGRATDIHHINARGMGGSQAKDIITNLMALCRTCHEKYGDKKQYKDFLYQAHANKIETHIEETTGTKLPATLRQHQPNDSPNPL